MGHSGEGRMGGLGSQAASSETSSVPESNNTRLLSVWGPASLLGSDPGHQHQTTGGVGEGHSRVGDGERRREGRMTGDTESMIDQVWGEGMI